MWTHDPMGFMTNERSYTVVDLGSLTLLCLHLESPSSEFSVTSQFCERSSMLQIDALGNVVRIAFPDQEDMKAFIEACH